MLLLVYDFWYTEQTENDALQQFLAARNPKNEHSLTLESLLIKPIQVNNWIYIYEIALSLLKFSEY